MLTNETEPVQNDSSPRILRYFATAHLPEHLALVAGKFASMAWHIVDTVPAGPERTAGLRKLLEAKDCIVRAALDLPNPDA